jgi:hypothetical protein
MKDKNTVEEILINPSNLHIVLHKHKQDNLHIDIKFSYSFIFRNVFGKNIRKKQ